MYYKQRFLALTYLFVNSRNTEWGIANVMEASGLKEVLELIYAENAVTQMLSGKAYARAIIRGHFWVDTALSSIVLGRAYGVNLSM